MRNVGALALFLSLFAYGGVSVAQAPTPNEQLISRENCSLWCRGQDTQRPDRMKDVKKLTECLFDVDTEDRSKEVLARKRVATYNDHGDMVEEATQFHGDTFVESYAYEYDGKNRKTASVYRMDGALRMKSTFNHTVDGGYSEARMVHEGKKGEEKPVRASSYDYNPKGLLIGEAHNSARGPADPRLEYRYDEKNRLSERRVFFASSPFPEITSYSYDEQGVLLTQTVKDEEGSVLEKIVYTRNPWGDPVLTQYFGREDKEYDRTVTEYAYDSGKFDPGARILIKKEEKSRGETVYRRKRWTYQYEFHEKK